MIHRSLSVLPLLLGLLLLLPQPLRAENQPRVTARPKVDLACVDRARVMESVISGNVHQTLVVDFSEPMDVLSTLEGFRRVIRAANHYVPHPAWSSLGMAGVPELVDIFWRSLNLDPEEGAMLITGAGMDNLAVERVSEAGLTVYALVTAGVRGNAMRLGADRGLHVEPGTINALILTNRRLSPRAMTRAMITATEAKSAALQDLDIRSSYQPRLAATGTGTDNLIIVQGVGASTELTGGHSRLGELIARAMYAGVRDAIARQNGITAPRSVIERLRERKINPAETEGDDDSAWIALTGLVDKNPDLKAWLEAALALDDAWQRGWLSGMDGHIAEGGRIAGRMGVEWSPSVADGTGPLEVSLDLVRYLTARSGRTD